MLIGACVIDSMLVRSAFLSRFHLGLHVGGSVSCLVSLPACVAAGASDDDAHPCALTRQLASRGGRGVLRLAADISSKVSAQRATLGHSRRLLTAHVKSQCQYLSTPHWGIMHAPASIHAMSNGFLPQRCCRRCSVSWRCRPSMSCTNVRVKRRFEMTSLSACRFLACSL